MRKIKVDKKKIFNIFFGTSKLPRGKIIITPISKIYQEVKNFYPLIEESSGWWQRAVIRINSELVTILKISPGSHIKDCLESLKSRQTKKVFLLGFCGALNKMLKIGEIVIPIIAILKNLKSKSLFKTNESFKIITTSQMILKYQLLKKFYKNKIDLLDMETFYLYEWGNKNNIITISILIITDQPLFLPFFLCGRKEFKKIDKAILKIVQNLVNDNKL